MPARLSQQDEENGMMEAAGPQAVSAGLANSDGVGAPRLHPRYFLRSCACQRGWHNKRLKIYSPFEGGFSREDIWFPGHGSTWSITFWRRWG
jgi:hypothetical protein